MHTRLIILSSAFLLLTAGCDESPAGSTVIYTPGFASERSPYVFEGTVVDGRGNPAAGVDIHYLFRKSSSERYGRMVPQKAMPTSTISFDIPTGTHISLHVFRLGTREHVMTLLDTTLRAGIYSFSSKLDALTNGWYVYRLTGDGIFKEYLMMHFNPDFSTLLKAAPLARTDVYGRFRLPQSVFGLEEKQFLSDSLRGTSFYALHQNDSIGFVIHRSGSTKSVWTAVNTNSNTTATFTLQ